MQGIRGDSGALYSVTEEIPPLVPVVMMEFGKEYCWVLLLICLACLAAFYIIDLSLKVRYAPGSLIFHYSISYLVRIAT
jgi:hypothetical protein